jgi:hypothetical protein
MHHAPEVEARRRYMETCILKKRSKKVLRCGLPINGRDEHAAPMILAVFHILLR